MARTRKQIRALYQKNRDKIIALHNQNEELEKEAYLLSDKEQWFTEEEEEWGKGKKKRTVKAGRIHWNEDFKDEDTGNYITIERSRLVKEDGQWI